MVTPANGHDLIVTTKHESLRYLSIVIPAIFKPESRKNLLDTGFRRYDEKDFHTKTLKKLVPAFADKAIEGLRTLIIVEAYSESAKQNKKLNNSLFPVPGVPR